MGKHQLVLASADLQKPITLVVLNQPWWKYLQHGYLHKLQIRAFLSSLPETVIKHLSEYYLL